MIPRQRWEPAASDRVATHDTPMPHHASLWPTVDQTNEVICPMQADTVLQILKGEGHYYGLGCYSLPPALNGGGDVGQAPRPPGWESGLGKRRRVIEKAGLSRPRRRKS